MPSFVNMVLNIASFIKAGEFLDWLTEQLGSSGNVCDLYLGGSEFESLPGERL
jgi:hypothetical protein